MKKFAGSFFTASFARMKKIIALFVGLCIAVLSSGCEWNAGDSSGDGDGGSSKKGPDDLDVSNAIALGTHAGILPQNAAITRVLHSADQSGGFVFLDFDPLNWPTQGKVDGGVHMYWEDGNGQVIGGLFDFHGRGQTAKTMENAIHGYLGGKRPAKGQTVYFCIVNLKGTERTNVKMSNNPW